MFSRHKRINKDINAQVYEKSLKKWQLEAEKYIEEEKDKRIKT